MSTEPENLAPTESGTPSETSDSSPASGSSESASSEPGSSESGSISTVNLVTGEAVEPEAEPEPLTPEQMDQYECRACGYTYEPVKGDNKGDIPAGTPFEELPAKWRCPVCGAPTRQFSNIGPQGAPSGFKENLNYGFGVNAMTPGQKNVLIFGSLGIAIIFFLSLYSLR